MSNLLTTEELAGLRKDFDELLGKSRITGVDDEAPCTVRITRTLEEEKGDPNPDTLKYDDAITTNVYEGPFTISPVIYRRDRQEDAGGTSRRIRQYRGKGPYDMPIVEIGDDLEVLTSSDPNMAGLKLDVVDYIYEEGVATRRLTLVDTAKRSSSSSDC